MAKVVYREHFDASAYGGTIHEFVQERTYALAMRKLKEQTAKGFDRMPVVITDRIPRKDPRAVRPYGRIEFVARPNMEEAVLWALEQLRLRSPIGPAAGGHYKDDHVVMINKIGINGSLREALRQVKPGDRVQIVNPRIYARKIEPQVFKEAKRGRAGRTKRKAQSRQARMGVYRVVLRALVQRYSKSMFFDFTFVKLNTGAKVWGDQGGRYRRDGSRTRVKRIRRDQVYPCLNFFLKEVNASNASFGGFA